ncbi:hypothetical protein [Neobacillus niacini]|uniref:hypothetical protein n=1 Tax=Neobacillus niacini TaxID=86668 RepID=UPI003983C1CB
MHFRQFLIFALMVSAAMFFPDNAFAEKNELRSQKGQANSSIPDHASVSEPAEEPVSEPASGPEPETIPAQAKMEEAKSLNKSIPEHARDNQAQAKQQSAPNIPNQAAMEKQLPVQANGNGKSEVKKAEKVVQGNGPKQKEAVQAKPTVEKLNPKNYIQDKGKVEKADNPVVLRGEDIDRKASESVEQEPQKAPVQKEKIPKVNQTLNQTQRSSSSGGQSNDRVNHGINNLSLLDKWFEWDRHYFENKLVQPYLSRLALMNTQWVNAPPSKPPEECSFINQCYPQYMPRIMIIKGAN